MSGSKVKVTLNYSYFVGYNPATVQHEGPSFITLPGEVRNMIYTYALDVGKRRVPLYKCRDPKAGGGPIPIDQSVNLFRVSQQVAYEASTLLYATTTAYIPVIEDFDMYAILSKPAASCPGSATETWATMMASVMNFRDLHIHLHFMPADAVGATKVFIALYQILQVISGPGQMHWLDTPRSIMLHIDHFYADELRLGTTKSPTLWNIIVAMGKVKHITWTLAYYIHTGHHPEWTPTATWHAAREHEFKRLEDMCRAYPNITVRPEVRGAGKWQELAWTPRFLDMATTDVTPISTIWPTIADELHGHHGKERREMEAGVMRWWKKRYPRRLTPLRLGFRAWPEPESE